jgi:hypothetical protein
MAEKTHGHHLMMDQMTYIQAFLTAICLKQAAGDQLTLYEQEIKDAGMGNLRNFQELFATMFGREMPRHDHLEMGGDDDDYAPMRRAAPKKPRGRAKKPVEGAAPDPSPLPEDGAILEAKLNRCPPAKYQIMDVDADCSIRDFVMNRGVAFKVGRGYYEFNKPEIIQSEKHIVLWEKKTGDLYEGETARHLIKLTNVAGRQKPADHPRWRIFIQSTSANRKLLGGTKFLYEAADYREELEEGVVV